MLIYAVADIHGSARNLETIENMVARSQPDLLIAAGDLAGHFRSAPGGLIQRLDGLGIPVFAIMGNTDGKHTKALIQESRNIVDLHMKRAEFSGVKFVGAGGTFLLPFRSRLAFRESRVVQNLSSLLEPGCVLVVHPPPYGAADRVMGRFNAGSKGAASLIRTHAPALCLCGHIHENAGFQTVGPTLVANCAMGRDSAGALVEMEGDKVLRWDMASHPHSCS